jgi:hypothetical protein
MPDDFPVASSKRESKVRDEDGRTWDLSFGATDPKEENGKIASAGQVT